MVSIFVVLSVHGLNGTRSDFENICELLLLQKRKVLPQLQFYSLVSKANEGIKTRKSIRECGFRLAKEVHEFICNTIETLPTEQNITIYFSIIAHSLGGIISKACLPHLFSHGYYSLLNFGNNFTIIPVSFLSICTPHLGINYPTNPSNFQAWFRSLSLPLFGGLLFGRGIQDLLLQADSETILLDEMANPDGIYFKTLNLFQFKTTIALVGDSLVELSSALIMNSNINLDSLIIKEGFTLIAHHGFDINSSISRMNTLLPNWSPYDDGIENICKGVPEHLNNRIFHVDNYNQFAFCPNMAWNMNQIVWRRVIISFQGHSLDKERCHALIVNPKKKFLFKSDVLEQFSQKSSRLLVSILFDDFNSLVKNTNSTNV